MNKVRLQQRDRKYLKVPSRNHRAEEYKTELKNTIERFNSRLDKVAEKISKLEDRAVELTTRAAK